MGCSTVAAKITIEFDSNVCFAQNYSIKHQRLKQKSNSLYTLDGQEKPMQFFFFFFLIQISIKKTTEQRKSNAQLPNAKLV